MGARSTSTNGQTLMYMRFYIIPAHLNERANIKGRIDMQIICNIFMSASCLLSIPFTVKM
jgi:hypothetical protein